MKSNGHNNARIENSIMVGRLLWLCVCIYHCVSFVFHLPDTNWGFRFKGVGCVTRIEGRANQMWLERDVKDAEGNEEEVVPPQPTSGRGSVVRSFRIELLPKTGLVHPNASIRDRFWEEFIRDTLPTWRDCFSSDYHLWKMSGWLSVP